MQNIVFYVQLLTILCATTALAGWAGWGLARLALPAALQPYRALLTPLLGYALVLVVDYWFVWTVSGVPLALAVLLPITGALNIMAWHRGGPPRLAHNLRAHGPILLVALVTLLVGISPLLHYGQPAVIGAGWDIETALPTARYLERGPIAAIAQAPANPLRDLVRDPPRIGKTVGFAVWQASLSALTRIEAILTFTPLLSWLRALGVLAVYVLFRATLGLGRGPALLGAAWTSAGALMLWISYFNFEKQMAAWPLIALGLLIAVAAVEELAGPAGRQGDKETRRPGDQERSSDSQISLSPPRLVSLSRLGVALLAAIVLTALAVAYYPALTLWAPLAFGLAAATLIQSPNRARLLGAALALVALTTLVAAPTLVDYWHGFAFRYNEQLTSLGVLRYIPATDVLGLTPYIQGQRSTPPTPPWAWAGLAVMAALILAGLVVQTKNQEQTTNDESDLHPSSFTLHPSSFRLRWLGMAGGALLYLAWLRYWQQYPYAYLKGSAYAGFVFMGLAAAGWQALASRLAPRARLIAVAAPLLLLAIMAAGQLRIIGLHWAGPGLYPEDFPALLELRQRIPSGSTVTLADNLHTEGVTSGLAAYMLDHATVWGHVKTGYTSATTGTSDALGEYALLPKSEDPTIWGYQDQIWSGGSYALYRRPPDTLAQLRPEALLAPGEALPFTIGGDRLSLKPAPLPGGSARQIKLTLAAMRATTASLDGKSFAIPAGAAQLILAPSATGRALELRNTGAAPLLLRSITLAGAGEQQADAVLPLPAALVTSAEASSTAQTVTTSISALLPDGGPLTLAVDIWDSRRGTHYGWYGITLNAGPGIQTATLNLDLHSGSVPASAGAGPAFSAQFVGLREGDYTAHLNVSAGPALLAPPGRLFSFRVGRDGAISKVETQPIALIMTTTDRPPQPLDARVGDDVRLLGYALANPSLRPGDTLTLTLWWAALAAPLDERSVLIHLVGPGGAIAAQADGAPVHGARPTNQWRAGEVVIDTHDLALPADLAPGQYTLVFGMYRWPSLDRLPLSTGGGRQPDDVVHIPITITR